MRRHIVQHIRQIAPSLLKVHALELFYAFFTALVNLILALTFIEDSSHLVERLFGLVFYFVKLFLAHSV